ncbi:MAG: hypothetical protein M0016_00190 [Deltaproteobacteria bacterium]|jgi:metal-responsive CopG/Arc/MetJ family transcriptional regulator|nr:hypothetical protein [Deltaproteobacteria bacterium]MCL5880266.1 hypothetical protein [Deltaproteobacteria bacterium]MDA8303580.1 hypothetical protein [Deltaproteobacteria bacterium]
MSKIINMSLPEPLYAEVVKMAKIKGVSRSRVLKEALNIYISEEKRWQNIRKIGNETAKKLGIKDENGVEKIREEYWKEKNNA